MEHRDSPEIEQEQAAEPRSSPGRRFARLVESPVSRRVALPRLIVAGGLFLALAVFVVIGVSKLIQLGVNWVHQRSEHQFQFSQIELVPPPDPWVVGGSARILEEVRLGAKLGESVPLLDLDLKELEKDFRRCFWVKDVLRVDRSRFGHLIVELSYRKPVAYVKLELSPPNAFVIDEQAVVLPYEDIRWTSERPPFRVQGIADPLIEIKNLPDSTPRPKPGLAWKRKAEGDSLDDPDPMVLRAARLALFLKEKSQSSSPNRVSPNFVTISLPDGPDHPFYLIDSDQNLVKWGKASGDEGPIDPSCEARWGMLLDWVRANGPLRARRPNYLEFTRTGAKLIEIRNPRKEKSVSPD